VALRVVILDVFELCGGAKGRVVPVQVAEPFVEGGISATSIRRKEGLAYGLDGGDGGIRVIDIVGKRARQWGMGRGRGRTYRGYCT
jgi:hypothetical protein